MRLCLVISASNRQTHNLNFRIHPSIGLLSPYFVCNRRRFHNRLWPGLFPPFVNVNLPLCDSGSGLSRYNC